MSCPIAKKVKFTGNPVSLAQAVTSKLTSAAIFLVFKLESNSDEALNKVKENLAGLSGITRSVGMRVPDGELSAIAGIGSDAWDMLFPHQPRPKDLHPFKELKGAHTAPSTPGADLLFHLRGRRQDIVFEVAHALTSKLKGHAKVIDEVHGFQYFDERDLLGFVDGTENPKGDAAITATVIKEDEESDEFVGGSYVIVQKYLHDLEKWDSTPVETQEKIIGREKLSDIELDDDAKPSYAHNVLTNLDDDPETGEAQEILRDNMPFGSVGDDEFGTYFIGYCRKPAILEEMLHNMFIGKPKGNYDRILDYSVAKTGALFFIPPADFIDSASDK